MDNNLLFILFAAVIFMGLLMLVIISTTLSRGHAFNKAEYRQKIEAIERLLEGKGIAATHMAIMEADKLVDKALKEKGVKGNTMGERLKNGKDLIGNRNNIWAAHKLRNRIAHEDNVSVSITTARRAVAAFKACLRELGAI